MEQHEVVMGPNNLSKKRMEKCWLLQDLVYLY